MDKVKVTFSGEKERAKAATDTDNYCRWPQLQQQESFLMAAAAAIVAATTIVDNNGDGNKLELTRKIKLEPSAPTTATTSNFTALIQCIHPPITTMFLSLFWPEARA